MFAIGQRGTAHHQYKLY